MAKPASKTKETIQARLGSLAKAGTKGRKRSSSLKNIAPLISNTERKTRGSSSNITNLAATTHDNDSDSIDDQDDDVVLAGVPNHSFLSPQKLQGEVIYDDLDDDNDNDNHHNGSDNDDHFGMEYNATVFYGRENSVAAAHQARRSASHSSANITASIAPDLSTLSKYGLIAVINEALRYRDHWSMKLQLCKIQCCPCRINHRSITQLFQDIKKEHWLWANHWLKRMRRISASLVISWFILLSRKYSGRCESCSFC